MMNLRHSTWIVLACALGAPATPASAADKTAPPKPPKKAPAAPSLRLQLDDDKTAEEWEAWAEQFATQMEGHAALWEDWAEQYAAQWENWAEQFEGEFETFGEAQAEQWEDWAEQYAEQWEDWAEQMEDFDPQSPEDVERFTQQMVRNLSGLKHLPIDDMVNELVLGLPTVHDLDIGELDGLEELIEQSVEGALAGLETMPIDQEALRRMIEQQVDTLNHSNAGLRELLSSKRGRVRAESAQQWSRIDSLMKWLPHGRMSGSGEADDDDDCDDDDCDDDDCDDDDCDDDDDDDDDDGAHALKARPGSDRGRTVRDQVRQRLRELRDSRNGGAVIEKLHDEKAAIDNRDREINELREQIDALRAEVDRLRKQSHDKAQ